VADVGAPPQDGLSGTRGALPDDDESLDESGQIAGFFRNFTGSHDRLPEKRWKFAQEYRISRWNARIDV